MKVAIASDHAGWKLKEAIKKHLVEKNFSVFDFGSFGEDSVDYTDFAEKFAMAVIKGEVERGILICGTGIGMSITSNKFPGVRAALCFDEYTAKMSRLHNDANILVLGGRVLPVDTAFRIVDVWFETEFEGGRH
jgi:ribose 5-phosphate isomerase B